MSSDPRSPHDGGVLAGGRAGILWGAYLVALLGAIYLPIGRGFIKDDFRWIVTGTVSSAADVVRVFSTHVGVYRPAVALSFGVNHALSGLHPLTYGLTNFALLLACVLALRAVGRALGLAPGTAWFAAGLWALNFHGVGTTQLWISGRTALLLSLFGALSVWAWLRDRPALAAAAVLMALFSKEEAVLLPALLCVVAFTTGTPGRWRLHLALSLAAVCAYLVLRYASGAFWPGSAPAYYRPSLDPSLLLENLAQYADRTATLAVAVVVTLAIATRTRPRVPDRRLVLLAGAWIVLGYLPTIAIPARSSLYVLWPGMPVAILAGMLAQSLWVAQPEPARRRLVIAALVLPLLLYPVYRARNERLSRLATLSDAVITHLRQLDATLPAGVRVVLLDDRSTHANLSEAFGTHLEEVRTLAIPRAAAVVVEPPPEGVDAPPAAHPRLPAHVALRVIKGRVELLDR